MVILTSDHGESFWKKKNCEGKEVQGHGESLYEEEMKIPLVIYLPKKKVAQFIRRIVQHIDIYPDRDGLCQNWCDLE